MNRSFKPVFIMAVLAIFGVAGAQQQVATEAAAIETAPTVETAPVAEAAPAAVETAPVAEAAPAAVETAPVVETAPAVVETAPVVEAAPVADVPASVAEPVAADSAVAESAPVAVAQTLETDSMVVLIVEQPAKKKKRSSRAPKNDFVIVDVPANFEIQARKIMPVSDSEWSEHNLDTWWGRANLMILTESENFIGKIHLRMYPGQLFGYTTPIGDEKGPSGGPKDRYGRPEVRDIFQLYEAWAWHKGDYVNIKIGRWDNTARFGSRTFGGYVDAKRDKNDAKLSGKSERDENLPRTNVDFAAKGFMSTYMPENALQFGLNNFSENVSLDVALVSGDNHLNRGDLRVYFSFKDLAGMENMNIGIGYRSNVFDEIYNKRGDVTHTVDLGFRMPLVKDAGLLKDLSLFGEAALIGLDDQIGDMNRADNGGSPKECNPVFPILGGLDFSFYRGLDKIVIEAEYQSDRKNQQNTEKNVKDVQGSIYIQKKLNDRFTLNMGVQNENNTKDFSFAGRLQGRIN